MLVGLLAACVAPAPPAAAPEEEAAPAAEPIKVGFFSPTTGFAAADGTSALQSAELSVKLVNDAGGVLGRPLELIHYDDAAKPDQAASIARKLIEQDQVVAGISGSYSGATRAAAPVFQEAGVPMISAYAIHPEITKTGDLIFRVGTLATVQGGKIKAAEPDAVYATGYYNEAANLVSQAKDEGLGVQIIGQEGYDSPKFIELAGPAAEGVIITTDLNRDSERSITQRFLSEYEATYGEAADMVGASAFDAVQVLAYAIETAGSTDPKAIAGAISGLQDFEDAASGPFWYYTDGREVVRPVSSQIVEDGAFHLYHEFTDEGLVSP
jgi:branched-chain amino acid transport system substrate-binding protein